jgi:prepilin-type N-terminal cleavage/methylation domain-containing protein
MRRILPKRAEAGFTLLELMVAAGVFLLLSGAAFSLLALSQKSYQNESQVLNSFQEARLGLDQMIRDINISGYPPPTAFSTPPSPDRYASTPVAWPAAQGYPGAVCTVGTTCGSTPGDFDLIIETEVPGITGVQWIRYQLNPANPSPNTLYRAMVPKIAGDDPDTDTQNAIAPFVQNVMNNAPVTQIAQFQAIYPQMYNGGGSVRIFEYMCDAPGGTQPCTLVPGATPSNIRDVEITLIVMAPTPDAQTGQPKLVQLNGRGHRFNPNQ